MDSLEPEINNVFGKAGVLGTIKEYDSNGRIVEDELDDENLNDFHEFDVSFIAWNKNERRQWRRVRLMTVCLSML